MSASLVGSEMCIRDSRATSRTVGFGRRSWWARSTTPETSASASRPTSAVSYTHLTLPTICSV
eukprot:12642522-Alexandrium_andersonii.AAC.1